MAATVTSASSSSPRRLPLTHYSNSRLLTISSLSPSLLRRNLYLVGLLLCLTRASKGSSDDDNKNPEKKNPNL